MAQRTWRGLILSVAIAAAAGLAATAAQAVPVVVTLEATVTNDPTGYVGAGTVIPLNLYLDDATPNEAAGPDYLATNPGSVDLSFLGNTFSGGINSISATGGSWAFDAYFNILGAPLPVVGTLDGIGLTPGQILPDFTLPLSGSVISVDLTDLLGDGMVLTAVVTNISIAAPEPSMALLLAIGLAGVAALRRRPR